MAVAMKDLEIRGAGNLLGGEQSGHIAAVGFDLYIRLVGEAVADFRGEAPEELPEVKVELPIDANLPRDYITGERLRLEAYRRIAEVGDAGAAGRGAGRADRPLRRPTGIGREPARSGRISGSMRGATASPRSPCRAATSASPRWSCANPRRCGCNGSTRARSSRRRSRTVLVPMPDRQRADGVAAAARSRAARLGDGAARRGGRRLGFGRGGRGSSGPARLRCRLTRRLRLVKLRSIASRRFVSRTGIAALALVAIPAVTSCENRIGLAASVGSQRIETVAADRRSRRARRPRSRRRDRPFRPTRSPRSAGRAQPAGP